MHANYMDPFHVWKSFYNEIEPKMTQTMQSWLESEEYASVSGQLMNATLQMEQNFIKAAEQVFQTYNIPTLKDVARLGQLVVGLESKVDQLDERLQQLEAHVKEAFSIRDELGEIAMQLESIRQGMPQQELKAESGAKSRRRIQKSEHDTDTSGSGNE